MANMTPSLAQMTGTRADSASKHIRVCRVAQDYISNWIGKTLQTLKSNKLQHAVQKDDFFVACGRPLFDANGAYNNKKPYAVGLKCLHDLDESTRRFIAVMNHFCVTQRDFRDMQRGVKRFLKGADCSSATLRAINGVPDFYMAGVALTTAFPHGHIGDTALSVLTGGITTIMNGPFEINAGDRCTWIWSFELTFFAADGARKPHSLADAVDVLVGVCGVDNLEPGAQAVVRALHAARAGAAPALPAAPPSEKELQDLLLARVPDLQPTLEHDTSAKRRRMFFDEQMRVVNKMSQDNAGKHGAMPLLIPLPPNATYADRRRVFGECLMAARPFERTDIMIRRQGL